MNQEYYQICNIDINKIGKYKKKVVTSEVILTKERLNGHILINHENEYFQLKSYIKDIIENPDYVLEDISHINTLIFLKHIKIIDKKARIVIKLAVDKNEKIYTKNSIITIMRQRDKSWEQTLKNKGRIIFEKY